MADDEDDDLVVLGDDSTDYSTADDIVSFEVESTDVYDLQTQTYGFTNLPNSSVAITISDSGTTVTSDSSSHSRSANRRSSNSRHSSHARSARAAKRNRGSLASSSPAKASPKRPNCDLNASNDNDSACIICLEQFENYGKHRIASLKCGHVFGESCIYTWLNRGDIKKCPQCNTVAKKKDIRTIYCPKLVALDVAERNKALEDLEQEKAVRMRLEVENCDLKLKIQTLSAEFERFKRKVEQEQMQLQQLSTSNSSNRSKIYRPVSQLPLGAKGSSRRVVFDPGQKVLVASQALDFLSINQGHGLRKISGLDMKTSKMIKCHSDSIKALAAFDSKVLSGGNDKKLCLTCLKSDVVIQQWTMPSNTSIWACEFNRKNNNLMYVAAQNGSIFTYDARELSKPVNCFEPSDKMRALPITSLSFVPFEAASTFNSSGLLVGGFDGCKYFDMQENEHEPTVHVFGSELKGSCTSMDYDATSGHLLASFRPGLNVKNVRHVVSKLSTNTDSGVNCFKEIRAEKVHEFYGGMSMKQLTRSCIYSSPAGNIGQLFVSAFDQSSETLIFWETTNGSKVQNVKLKDFVCLDLCPSVINNEHYVTALSDNSLKVFKYS